VPFQVCGVVTYGVQDVASELQKKQRHRNKKGVLISPRDPKQVQVRGQLVRNLKPQYEGKNARTNTNVDSVKQGASFEAYGRRRIKHPTNSIQKQQKKQTCIGYGYDYEP
jgi:hypothetical protein